MFQLWKLVLLCGLPAGTSASLLDNLGKDVLRKLKSGLEEGLDNPDSTLENKSPAMAVKRNNKSELWFLHRVKIRNLHILDITFEETPDCKGAIVKIPITAEVSVNLPVLGEIVDLALNSVLQYSVSVETDEETEVSTVVVEECRRDQHIISLSVLGRPDWFPGT
ncbi:short palate, lung and nasal epithelium carcinoma-associated protein 2B-like [Dama dama]